MSNGITLATGNVLPTNGLNENAQALVAVAYRHTLLSSVEQELAQSNRDITPAMAERCQFQSANNMVADAKPHLVQRGIDEASVQNLTPENAVLMELQLNACDLVKEYGTLEAIQQKVDAMEQAYSPEALRKEIDLSFEDKYAPEHGATLGDQFADELAAVQLADDSPSLSH